MKRIGWTVICLLASTFACFAGVVTPERSAGVAADYYSRIATTKGAGTGEMRLLASFPVSDAAAPGEAPAFYVYGRETGGYVLVAGDDVARPILGYSDRGHFPSEAEMPDNMKWLLKLYAHEIGYARAQGWEPDEATRRLWSDPATATKASQPVLLTTATWNQWAPFNDLCPKVDGQECPCGCVATAIAIIMRYHKWPAKGEGTIPGYGFDWDYERQEYRYYVDAVQLGHTYEWDKMPMDYSSVSSQDSRFQVARLIRDIGVMCEMNYAPDGSGASSLSPIPMAEYFGYDKQMRYLDREYYSDVRWEEMMRDEIDAGRPIFHCGGSNRGGHAFVIDGYNDRYFHINYGWGGSSNNYYTVTPISGHESDLFEFNKWQDMVTHIMPDQGGAPYVGLEVNSYAISSFGWDFRSPSFRTGEMPIWKTYSTGDAPTELAYCLFDKEDNFKEVLSDPFELGLGDSVTAPAVTCKAPSDVADGDCIKISRQDDHGRWEPLQQSRPNYIKFDKKPSLSEMVSVGHTYGLINRQSWMADEPDFFFRAYKDVYWELRTNKGEILTTSAEATQTGFVSDLGVIYTRCEFSDGDYVREKPYFEFFLPSGDYILFFRNFEEEMTLSIKL